MVSPQPTSKEVLELIGEWFEAKLKAKTPKPSIFDHGFGMSMDGFPLGLSDRDDGDEQKSTTDIDEKFNRAQLALNLYVAQAVETHLQLIIDKANAPDGRAKGGSYHELYPEQAERQQ